MVKDTSLNGTTEFVLQRHSYYKSVQDALDDGEYQCVITADINTNRKAFLENQIYKYITDNYS